MQFIPRKNEHDISPNCIGHAFGLPDTSRFVIKVEMHVKSRGETVPERFEIALEVAHKQFPTLISPDGGYCLRFHAKWITHVYPKNVGYTWADFNYRNHHEEVFCVAYHRHDDARRLRRDRVWCFAR